MSLPNERVNNNVIESLYLLTKYETKKISLS